jgi:hypothetical protein
MAVLALAAPVTQIGSASGSTPGAGIVTPNILPAAEAGVLTGNTGFTFPNNGAVLLRLCVGVAGAGNVTFLTQRTIESFGATIPPIAVVNSTNYLWGPFSPADFNDVNGLFNANISVVTGNTVGVYQLPASVFGR